MNVATLTPPRAKSRTARRRTQPSAHIVLYCPTLQKACGIATYTHMLAHAQGYPVISSLEELATMRCTHLHIQHEFGIFTTAHLNEVFSYCHTRGIHISVTMHTVIPMPSIPEYFWFRCDRFLTMLGLQSEGKGLYVEVPIKLARCLCLFCEGLMYWINQILRGNLRLWNTYQRVRTTMWKRYLFIQAVNVDMARDISGRTVRWVWTRLNPDYDVRSFWHFRTSQEAIIKNADSIYVHCQEAEWELIRRGVRRVHCVRHGVQNARCCLRLHSRTDHKTHVGVFGFPNPHKGILEIIEACKKMRNVRLHIYASIKHDGVQTAYIQKVIALSKKHAWIDLCTDHLSIEEVVWNLSRCDVNVWFAYPPGGISASGSICQYVAAKRPIIASDVVMVGTLKDAVCLVPPGDIDALRKAIKTYRGGIRALKAYADTYAWDRLEYAHGKESEMIRSMETSIKDAYLSQAVLSAFGTSKQERL